MFTRDDDGEPCGWWPARIVLKKGEVIMVLLLCDVVLQSANTNAYQTKIWDALVLVAPFALNNLTAFFPLNDFFFKEMLFGICMFSC